MNTSILLTIRDEIALEGLDGITFEALWTRLRERERFIRRELETTSRKTADHSSQRWTTMIDDDDEKFKNTALRIVAKEAKNGRAKFYQLPEPRCTLLVFDRNETYNEATGTLLYDQNRIPCDIYSPVVPIADGPIRGSCASYDTRVDVTAQVLHAIEGQPDEMTFGTFFGPKSEWSIDRLVIVAEQRERSIAIFGPFNWHTYRTLKYEAYCILEYIARQRFYGYLNSKLEAMNFADPRIKNSFYYYRQQIMRLNLIIQFPIYFYDSKRKLCNNSLVHYLPRFKPTNANPIDWKAVEIGNMFVERQVSVLAFSLIRKRLNELRNFTNAKQQHSVLQQDDRAHQEEEEEEEKDAEEEDEKNEQKFEKPKSKKDQENRNKKSKSKLPTTTKNLDPKKFRDFLSRYPRIFAIQKMEGSKEFEVKYLQPLDRVLTHDDLYPSFAEVSKANASDDNHGGRGGEDEEDGDEDEDDEDLVKAENDNDNGNDNLGDEQNGTIIADDNGDVDIDSNSTSTKNTMTKSGAQSQNRIDQHLHQQRRPIMRRYFMEKVYHLIDGSGPSGMTRVQILRCLDVPNALIRSALRLLTKQYDLVRQSVVQRGRQKLYVYIARPHGAPEDSKPTGDAIVRQDPLGHRISDLTRSRLQMLLEYVAEQKFVDNLFFLRRHMLKREAELNFKIDMRTIVRFLLQLAQANFITLRAYRLTHGMFWRNTIMLFYNEDFGAQLNDAQHQQDSSRSASRNRAAEQDAANVANQTLPLETMSASNGRYENSIERHLLLRNKFHHFAHQQVDLQSDIRVTPIAVIASAGSFSAPAKLLWQDVEPSDEPTDSADPESKMMMEDSIDEHTEQLSGSSETTDVSLTISPSCNKLFVLAQPAQARRLYGTKVSKLQRSFIFYRYLFYMLVDEPPRNDFIYPDDWRFHVPKLCHIFTNLECKLLDVLIYLPISVFRDIYQIAHIIPGLEELLRDPIRQHEMLYRVDPLIRRHLLHNRKSIYIIYELLDFCTNLGLLTQLDRDKILPITDTIQFRLNTSVRLRCPLVDAEDSHFKTYTRAADGSVQYYFNTLPDFDRFVEDVELHLGNKRNCKEQNCPFNTSIRIHSLYVFGYTAKHRGGSKSKKRKIKKGKTRYEDDDEDDDADEDEDEDEDYEQMQLDDEEEGNDETEHDRRKRKLKNAKLRLKKFKKLKISNDEKRCSPTNETDGDLDHSGLIKKKKKKAKPKKLDDDDRQNVKHSKTVTNKQKRDNKKKNISRKQEAKKESTQSTRKSSSVGRSKKSSSGKLRAPTSTGIPGQRILRQYWSREEDHFLLKCRLASLLLDSTSNSQTCIPRTTIRDLLHEYCGPKSFSKDENACARRLLNFSKRSYISRIIAFSLHELDYVDVAAVRPENRADPVAMIAAFKAVLAPILTHRFRNTDFFLSKQEILAPKTISGDASHTAPQAPKCTSNITLEHILDQYDVIDVSRTESRRCYVEPKNYYDIHAFVIINLMISSLVCVKQWQLHNQTTTTITSTATSADSSQSTPAPESPQQLQQRKHFMRTVFRSLKHFPEQLVNLIIRRMLQNDMIKRNSKKLKTQRNSCYAYRISPTFFTRLTKYCFQLPRDNEHDDHVDRDHNDRGDATASKAANERTIKCVSIGDDNSVFNSIRFSECLSTDVLDCFDAGEADQIDDHPHHLDHHHEKRKIAFHLRIPERFMSIPREYIESSEYGKHVSRSFMLSQNSTKSFRLFDNVQDSAATRGSSVAESEAIKRIDTIRFTDSMLINHVKVRVERVPHSASTIGSHSAAIALLRHHLRTFSPVELGQSTTTSTTECLVGANLPIASSAAITISVLDDYSFGRFVSTRPTTGARCLGLAAGPGRTKRNLTRADAQSVIECIRAKAELGIKLPTLRDSIMREDGLSHRCIDEKDLRAFLRFAESRQLIFVVGIVQRTYVHRDFIRYWLIHSFENLDLWTPPLPLSESSSTTFTTAIHPEIKPIAFIPKLWKQPDGRLDLETLLGYFALILGHLTFVQPICVEQQLIDDLIELIPPVQLIELLELLQTIDCVRKSATPLELTNKKTIQTFDDFFAAADCSAADNEDDARSESQYSSSSGTSTPAVGAQSHSMICNERRAMKMDSFSSSSISSEFADIGEPQLEVTYEATIDCFSRLSLFAHCLRKTFCATKQQPPQQNSSKTSDEIARPESG